jgi:hypothetical protein
LVKLRVLGIARGEEFVAVPGYGESSKIFDALNNAAKYFNEPFHANDLDIVDRAFKKLGLVRTSDRRNDAANAILKALIRWLAESTPCGQALGAGARAFAWCMTREVFEKIKMPVLEPWIREPHGWSFRKRQPP